MEKAEISIVVLLLVALLGSTHAALRFVEDYKRHSGKWWLKLIERRATWHEASYICKLEGRHLSSPNEYINNAGFEKALSRYPSGIWTDMRAQPNKDYYSDYLGHGMSTFLKRYVTSWYKKRPYNTLRCLVSMPGRRVRDSNCMEDLPFICSRWSEYWRFGNTACNSYDKEYRLQSTGSCYKLHGNGMEWQAALIKCRAEGGELAIADSYSEAQYLTKLLKSAENDTIKSGYGYNMAYVGIYYYHTYRSGHWVTIHGDAVGEENYAKELLDSGDPEHNCGGWSVGNSYVDLNCGIPHRFICEKRPNNPL